MKDATNENTVSKAFTNQSVIFDELYDSNYLVSYSRKIIRSELMRNLKPGNEILEINSGTGTDAIFLAQSGFRVTATDVSPGMVSIINHKISTLKLQSQVSVKQCSFWDLNKVESKQFDLLYSNFGGLNCTDKLNELLPQLMDRLKPGGVAVLVIMPVFCLWERIMILKGNMRLAFRRRRGKAASAHIEGEYFKVWYYNPSYIIQALKGQATLTRLQSLSLFVPPSAYRQFDRQYPKLLKWLEKMDALLTTRWPFRNWGDYVIITFQK